jgi:hypothetical protein
MELKNYFLTAGTNAWELNKSVIFPVEKKKFMIDIGDYKTWAYMLWTDLFIVPIVTENTNQVDVEFPVGNDWVDYFDGTKKY